jgi:hypothetical protein
MTERVHFRVELAKDQLNTAISLFLKSNSLAAALTLSEQPKKF